MYNKMKRLVSLILVVGIISQSILAVDYSYATKNTEEEPVKQTEARVYENEYIVENITELNEKIKELNTIYNNEIKLSNSDITEEESNEEKDEKVEYTEEIDKIKSVSQKNINISKPKSIRIVLDKNFVFKDELGNTVLIESIKFNNMDLEIDFNNNNTYDYLLNLEDLSNLITLDTEKTNIIIKNLDIIGKSSETNDKKISKSLLNQEKNKNNKDNNLIIENFKFEYINFDKPFLDFKNTGFNISFNDIKFNNNIIKNNQVSENSFINIEGENTSENISFENILMDDNKIESQNIHLINIENSKNLLFKNSKFLNNIGKNIGFIGIKEINADSKQSKTNFENLEFSENKIDSQYNLDEKVNSLIYIDNIAKKSNAQFKDMKFNNNSFTNNPSMIKVNSIESLNNEINLSVINSEFNNNSIAQEDDYIDNIIEDTEKLMISNTENAFIGFNKIDNNLGNINIDISNNDFSDNEFTKLASFISTKEIINTNFNISENIMKKNKIISETVLNKDSLNSYGLINLTDNYDESIINITKNIVEENALNGGNSVIRIPHIYIEDEFEKSFDININENSLSNNKTKNNSDYIYLQEISSAHNVNIKNNNIKFNEIINDETIPLDTSGLILISNTNSDTGELKDGKIVNSINFDGNDISENKLKNMSSLINILSNMNKNLIFSNGNMNNNEITDSYHEDHTINLININEMEIMTTEMDENQVGKTVAIAKLDNMKIINNKLNKTINDTKQEESFETEGFIKFESIGDGVLLEIKNSNISKNDISNIVNLIGFDKQLSSKVIIDNTVFSENKMANKKNSYNNIIGLRMNDRGSISDFTNNLFEKNIINGNGSILRLAFRYSKNFNSSGNSYIENRINGWDDEERLVQSNAILNFEENQSNILMNNDNISKNFVKNGSIIHSQVLGQGKFKIEKVNISNNEIENLIKEMEFNHSSSIIGINELDRFDIYKTSINNNILKGNSTIIEVKSQELNEFNMENNTIYGNKLVGKSSNIDNGGVLNLGNDTELTKFNFNNNTITKNDFPGRKAIVLYGEDIEIREYPWDGETIEEEFRISNNIFAGNIGRSEKNSNIDINLIKIDIDDKNNEIIKEVLDNELMEEENIGFDNIGEQKINNKEVFITGEEIDKNLSNDPLLSETSDIKIGRKDSTENLKTVPIKPEGLADNTGIKIDNITEDQKDYPRDEEKTDMGSAEMKWLNYNFNDIKIREDILDTERKDITAEELSAREFIKRDISKNIINYYTIINNKDEDIIQKAFYKRNEKISSGFSYNEDYRLNWFNTKNLDTKYNFPKKIMENTTIYAGLPEEVVYILKGKDTEYMQYEKITLEKLKKDIIVKATRNEVDLKSDVVMIYPNGEVINEDNISELTKEVQDKKITLKLGNITEEVIVSVIGKPVETIILASGSKYTDVLTATVLAYEKNAPILLSEKNSLTKETLDEIKRIDPTEIIISGGKDSVSEEVENILKDYTIERISGKDRYETAIKIGEQVRLLSPNKKDIALVDGTNFPDVITISTLASFNETPILLTQPNKLNQFTEEKIDEWKIENITIGGYYNSVSKGIEENLSKTKKVKRLGGIDRYETATLIGDEYRNITKAKENLIVVDGTNFPDGITVTSIANKLNGPILLTQPNVLNEITKNKINEWKAKNVYVAGEINSVSEKVFNKIKAKERIAGKDRYETAVKISQKFYELNK